MVIKVIFSSDCPFRQRQCRADDWECVLDDGPSCLDSCHFPEDCPLRKSPVNVSILVEEPKKRNPDIAVEGW